MKVEELVDSIVELQSDNNDKLMVFISPYYSTSSLFSNNSLFGSSSDISSEVFFIDINENKRISSFTNTSSHTDFINEYASEFLTDSPVELLTSNINSNSRYLELFNKLKSEAGVFSGTLCMNEYIIQAKFNASQINDLIKCSVSEDLYESGRIQFVKDTVKQLNRYLDKNNLFYLYNVHDIKTNYSDDDSLTDSLYSKLVTENIYNYFDLNYEQQSVTVNEKLLPGVIHQASIYTDANWWQDRGSYFNSPYESRLFAVKQIFGDTLKFNEGSPLTKYPYLGSSTDPNIYYPNVDLAGNFTSSFYSNWQASNYTSGSYTHEVNGYQPINSQFTELNNTNLHIVVTSSILQSQLRKLDEEIPFYSKVSFGIPKQEVDISSYEEMHESTIRTIQAGIVNNLYVSGNIIDESKLLLQSDSEEATYTESLININLLKFFNQYFNTTNESSILCEDGVPSEYIRNLLPIGNNTGLSDELFASLGFGARGDGGLNIYNENRLPIQPSEQDDNFNSLFNQSTIFDSHLTRSKTFIDFFAENEEIKKKLYLFTKIEKYSVDENGNETPVQNFYFDLRNYILNNPTDDITYYFYDNQIHTNKRYVYKQSQIFVIPALAYGYSSIDAFSFGSDLYLQAAVHSVPVLKLIELPTKTQSDIVVLEAPPCRPSVQFYPLLDEKNKLVIKIKPAKFDETTEPIIITDEDTSLFDKVLESQNSTGSVLFTYLPELSGIEKYEIFRIDSYPSSYKSFSNDLISYIGDVGATTKLFYDTVEANKPYFYCIRAKNYRGLPSNPTSVFKVTLIEDGEFYTLEQEEIPDLNKENIYNRTVVKDAKRFLYIKPSETQTLSKEEITGNAQDAISDFSLSSANSEVWGKKFKIRIRSKSTGKIIDLNIKFNKNNTGEYKEE